MSQYDTDQEVSEENSNPSEIVALKTELSKIVKQLENFQPEKTKKVGRPKINPEITNSFSTPLSCVLTSLCTLTQKVINRLETIEHSNHQLNIKLEAVESVVLVNPQSNSTPAEPHSCATVVSGPNSEPPKSIELIQHKFDKFEQDTLDTTIRLDGKCILDILKKNPNTSNNKQHPNLQQAILQTINSVEDQILKRNDIVGVSVVGTERKHLKIKLHDKKIKNTILKTFRNKKPTDIYINQYLTKDRSVNLYKLKQLKKTNSVITSVYTYSGNICCKLASSPDKYHYINSAIQLDHFIREHKLQEVENAPQTQ